MGFYQLGKEEQGNVGSTFFMIALIILTFIFSQIAVQVLALNYFGFSLIAPPESISKNLVFSLLLIPFAAVFSVILIAFPRIHKSAFKKLFTSREKVDWKRIAFSFGLWFLLLGATLLLDVFLGAELIFNFDVSSFIILLIISFTLLPIQTTVEELLFRGYLFQQIGKVFPKSWVGILITGTLFGLMHGSNPEIIKLGSFFIIYYIVTGIFLGVLAQMDGGLELSLGYHAANNIFAAIIVTNDWQAFQTDALLVSVSEPPQIIEVLITLLIVQPLLLFIFSRKYKWDNWKEKLLS